MQVQAQEKIWNSKFIFSWLANFFAFTTMYYLMSTIPLYTTEILDGNKSDVGMLFALYAVAGVLARPLAGRLLDSSGRVKVAWVSLLLLFLSVFAYSWAMGMMALMALRFVHGIFWGFSTTSLATVATDVIPVKRRGEGIGYFGLSMSFAMLLGPWLGLTVLHSFDYDVMFLVVSVIAALSCACLLGIRYEGKAVKGGQAGGFLERKILPYAIIVFFMAVGYSAILSFIVLFSQELGIENASIFFFVNAIAVIISRPCAGKMADKHGPAGTMCIGFATFFLTFICLYFAQGLEMLIGAALLMGIGFGILYSLCFVLSINAVAPARRGMANGTILTAFDIGFSVGSMGMGAVSMMMGLRSMYLLCAVAVMIPWVIYYLHDMRGQQSKADLLKTI